MPSGLRINWWRRKKFAVPSGIMKNQAFYDAVNFNNNKTINSFLQVL